MDYSTLKFIHLLGVVLFLGNIIVTALWKSLADASGRPPVIAFACRLVVITDLVFTAPGVLLIAIGGMGMLHAGGITLADRPHLMDGIYLFIAAALIWLLALIPIQRRMARISKTSAEAGHDSLPRIYYAVSKLWMGLGILATLLPIGTLWLMVNPQY